MVSLWCKQGLWGVAKVRASGLCGPSRLLAWFSVDCLLLPSAATSELAMQGRLVPNETFRTKFLEQDGCCLVQSLLLEEVSDDGQHLSVLHGLLDANRS
jgi:hypothetical protein